MLSLPLTPDQILNRVVRRVTPGAGNDIAGCRSSSEENLSLQELLL
jgi:hypothetical protein